jgi:transposase
MASEGKRNQDIAKELDISRPTVQLWRDRFLRSRINGIIKDAPRSGRIPKLSASKERRIVEATLQTTPPHATHWSVRTMAKAQRVSRMTVQRIWEKHNLKPHLVGTFKLSKDPNFFEKLTDVVGLYLNPPERAMVFCVDEKSQIQALDRTNPILPLAPGIPARQTHDYKRNGTTTLFAALSMLDGTLIGKCMQRHRHQEFLKFLQLIGKETPEHLDLHLIIDNYATHKHPTIKNFLKRHPRFHFHFIPTSSSWLNLIERWFRELTDKRIRRGTFKNVPQLIDAIMGFINHHNANPNQFVWSASVESIMKKIAKCQQV